MLFFIPIFDIKETTTPNPLKYFFATLVIILLWPLIYLVQDSMVISTPCSKGLKLNGLKKYYQRIKDYLYWILMLF